MKFERGIKHVGLDGRGISRMGGLKDHSGLEFLYLSENSITRIGGINDLVSLKELYLNKNKIKCTKEVNFVALKSLKKLYLNNNLIEVITDNYPPSLRKLYLRDNFIVTIQHIERITELKTVFLGGNPVRYITRYSYDFNAKKKVINGIDVESLEIIEE